MIRINKVIINCIVDLEGMADLEAIRETLKEVLKSKEVNFNYTEITSNNDDNE